MAKKDNKHVRVSLGGSLPFASVAVPGVDPSVVVTREPQIIEKEHADALKKAIKGGEIEGLKEENLVITDVDFDVADSADADD
jgi:ribosomal protein L22